ncbi:hypothetical protein GCM10009795_046570 [Nocardioides hankookensis]
MTPARGARLVLGCVLVIAPHRLLGLVGAEDADERTTREVARVLGARYLLQGVTGRPTGRAAAAVEAAHAASMLPLAVRSPRHRGAALVSAGVAAALGLADLVEQHR